MVTRILFSSLLLISACQKLQSGMADDLLDENTPELVQAQNGDLLSVNCLRQLAATKSVANTGWTNTCRMDSGTRAGVRGSHNSLGNGWSSQNYIIYYPPIYYSPTSYGNGANSFCSYIFGNQWANSCYSTLGYSPNYVSYYQSDCSSCLSTNRPRRCRNQCYSTGTYSWPYGSGGYGPYGSTATSYSY